MLRDEIVAYLSIKTPSREALIQEITDEYIKLEPDHQCVDPVTIEIAANRVRQRRIQAIARLAIATVKNEALFQEIQQIGGKYLNPEPNPEPDHQVLIDDLRDSWQLHSTTAKMLRFISINCPEHFWASVEELCSAEYLAEWQRTHSDRH